MLNPEDMTSRSSGKCGGEHGLSLGRAMIDPHVSMLEKTLDKGGCHHRVKITTSIFEFDVAPERPVIAANRESQTAQNFKKRSLHP